MRLAVLAAISAALSAIALSPAAAADGTVGADQILTVLQPVLVAAATAAASVIAVAATYVVRWLRRKLNLSDAEAEKIGLELDAQHRDALQAALTNAAGLALNRLGNEIRGKTIDVGNPAVADAVRAALKSAPDAIRYFGLDKKPDEIAQKIIAKIPQVANTISPPA